MPESNRITTEYIESRVRKVTFLHPEVQPSTLTICVITLDTGFHVVGDSACINESDFDEEVGRVVAHEKALSQLWDLFGFAVMEEAKR